jgi:hypothetical protein
LALPNNNTTQRAFPFMVLLSGIGLVASLWLWFFQKRRANFTAAIFILANMLCVAVLVLPFALATIAVRRENDPKGPPPLPPAPVIKMNALAPASWAELGYLAEDFNLAAGIHVSELSSEPLGAKLVSSLASNEGEPRADLMQWAVRPVEKYTGLKPEALDRLVLGMRLDAGLPVVMIVARTSKPYEPEALRQAQAPAVAVKYLERELYQFNIKPLGSGMLFAADPQTLILVVRLDPFAERDKKLLTTIPRTGAKGPPLALREILEHRFLKGTAIWWAGAEIQQPEVAMALFPLTQKDPELAQLVGKATSVAGGLYLHNDAALVGYLECPDRRATERLEALMEKKYYPQGAHIECGLSGAANHFSFQLFGTPEAVAANLQGVRLLGRFPGKQ